MRVFHSVAVMALCVILTACSKDDGKTQSASGVAPAVAASPSEAEKVALVAALPAPYNTGDLANGQRKFALCRSCHTIAEGGPALTGPNLYGVFGRQAGAVADYAYSPAVKAAGFVWDGEHLDKWLADPRGFLPGTKMSFAGLKDPKDRNDLIAYMKVETGYKPAP